MSTIQNSATNAIQAITSGPTNGLAAAELEDDHKQSEQVLNPVHTSITDLITDRVVTIGNVVKDLEEWATEREKWETTELVASHLRLYAILTKCYMFYTALKSESTGKSVRERMKEGLEQFILTKGMKTLANTHDMNRVVKAVFGEDRRKASAYASALRIALVSGLKTKNGDPRPVLPADLSAWLIQQGGIEEVRTAKANCGMTSQQRVATAKAAVQTESLMVFKPNSKNMLFDADDADRMMVLVVTYRPSGDLEVNTVVKGSAALTAALAAHYAANKEEMVKVQSTSAPAQQTATSLAVSKTI
jgi:hypothetical protein